MARRRPWHALLLAAGLAAGFGLGALTFLKPHWRAGGLVLEPRFDLARWARDLPSQLAWVAPFALLAMTMPLLRSLAWGAAIPPPAPRLRDRYHAVALGGLVHNAVPGKLGPIATAWLLARWSHRPMGAALGSWLVAKLLELGGIVALSAASGALAVGAPALRRIVLSGAAAFALLALAALAMGRFAPRAGARLAARAPRLGALLAAFGEGTAGAASVRRLGRAGSYALGSALAGAVSYALPLAFFGLGPWGGGLLLGVVTLGQFTPGLPGGLGLYYFLCAWGARQLGASPEQAATIAVFSHLGTFGANLLVGFASLGLHRGAVADLLRLRKQAQPA